MKKLDRIYSIIMFVLSILGMLFIIVNSLIGNTPIFGNLNHLPIFSKLKIYGFTIDLLLLCFFGFFAAFILLKKLRTNNKTTKSPYTQYLEKRLKELDNLLEQARNNSTPSPKNNKRDIIASMLDTTMGIDEYFTISKRQAKVSFYFSIVSSSVGLLFLLASIVMAMMMDNITAPIVSAISAAIAELIAGTVFWIHNKSALQLNHYYDALHENEKFLAAINLVGEISEIKKDDILIEIINKQFSIQKNTEGN